MNTYILSIIFASVILLIVAVISNLIKYEGGANPKDPRKRKIWFWIFAVLNPVLFYVMAKFIIFPVNTGERSEWNDSLPLAIIVGFIMFIILGFVLSKIFKNGKIGNWF